MDSGAWQDARLGAEVSDDTWRMWRADLDVTKPGVHLAEVRATNKQGQTQTEARVPPLPDGATGWPSVSFSVG